MILDEPIEEGGTDSAMNPMEALLCAIGLCQSIVAKVVAENMPSKILLTLI